MSHPYQQQPAQQPYGPPPIAPQPPTKPKRFGILALAVTGVCGLLLGSCTGALAAGGAADTAAAPAPTVTVTTTADPAPGQEEESEPVEPTEEPIEEPAEFKPAAKDFKISLKILKKECFGSAGCNITYRINPEYVGTTSLPDSGAVEVTYRVSGGDSGPADNTFTIEGGQATYEKEESISTSSKSTKLKVKVTEADYTP